MQLNKAKTKAGICMARKIHMMIFPIGADELLLYQELFCSHSVYSYSLFDNKINGLHIL